MVDTDAAIADALAGSLSDNADAEQALLRQITGLAARIEGVPTVAEFMDRRLAPAMNACAATAQRQEALATRIAHTNDLLRTRVGIVQEQQNRKILQSLNQHAAQQLRLRANPAVGKTATGAAGLGEFSCNFRDSFHDPHTGIRIMALNTNNSVHRVVAGTDDFSRQAECRQCADVNN